jgi:hypothetical protein
MLQRIYFNEVYRRKPGKRMEAEASIAVFYHRKEVDLAEAEYAVLSYVPTSL